MYSKEAKMMVAEQIIGMFDNNILRDCGMESFMGWLEDGYTFYESYDGKYTEEQMTEAVHLARDVADLVDNLSWELNTEPDDE